MSLDGATLVARGSAVAGEQANGIAQQYELAGTVAVTNIPPTDNSMQVILNGPVMNVIGTVPPGKPGVTQIKGVIQRATDLICNTLPLGNTLPSSNQPTVLGVPIENAAQSVTAGLSLAANHE